jgi:hypothetical protein
MAREGTATPVDPGLIARLVQGVRYTLTGVKPDNWFGPNQPLAPVAQEQALGRQFDYQSGINLRTTPRANEAISFEHMRGLADGYDFLRLVIETRKDQMCSLRWTVRPKDEKVAPDDRCHQIEAFLAMPDQEHDWPTWLRMLLEDMLVLDAATIYPRKTRGGEPYSFELVDGATIKRVIDETGRTPLPPDPAYQQVLKGLPAVNYSRDELIYAMRNPRTNRVYGYSPVEQIIMTVNIAMRRQLSQLQYYTEGNIPEAMIGVPDTWNPDQIRQFQDYWDSMLEGNTAARRHAKFIPGGMDVHETRPDMMKDVFDEWLVRIICFAFSISPSSMIAQVNRATAEVSKATADQEGILPTMLWVKSVMDLIVARWFGAPDLCFQWATADDLDAKTQADIHAVYLTAKVLTVDEVRADLGRDPLSPEQREELFPPMPEPLAIAAKTPEDEAKDEEALAARVKASMPDVHHHINVAAPQITLPAMPDIKMPDIRMPDIKVEAPIVNIQPPEVLVDIGATTVNAQFDHRRPVEASPPRKVTKTIVAERDKDGKLVGKVVEVSEDDGSTVTKTIKTERGADGSLSGTVTEE